MIRVSVIRIGQWQLHNLFLQENDPFLHNYYRKNFVLFISVILIGMREIYWFSNVSHCRELDTKNVFKVGDDWQRQIYLRVTSLITTNASGINPNCHLKKKKNCMIHFYFCPWFTFSIFFTLNISCRSLYTIIKRAFRYCH